MTLKEKVQSLNLAEKVQLLSGKDFWHLQGIDTYALPSIMVTDGPHGMRKQKGSSDHVGLSDSVPATCFPTATLLASTWDVSLVEALGNALGEECLTEKVSVLLGPGANIKRHPLCGRNFEYFSEDPLLSGKLAAAWIRGIQARGVGASLKHYALNNQETMRMVVDTIVDQRTMHEIYLKSFEIAVKEGKPWTVMSSYNKVNGTYASEHSFLLTDTLRKAWNYQGLVVTDWGACNDRVQGLIAGLDLEMPGNQGVNNASIFKALQSGKLAEKMIDQSVERNLHLMIKANQTLQKPNHRYDSERHHQLARKIASEGIVLLKNEKQILPLDKHKSIALIGAFAKQPRYQGSGSSLINPSKLSTAYDAFNKILGNRLSYAKGYEIKEDIINAELIEEAKSVAQEADAVVIMVGLTDLYESEGFDREHLSMPENHLALVDAISKVHENVVVVLSNGAPVLIPFNHQVKGIVEQYLAGQASGEALVDVVFGAVNPSGKLAETFPNNLNEIPASSHFPGNPKQVCYREGLYVGYRAYESMNIHPLYPFGHGLSYTSFTYDNLLIKVNDEHNKIEIQFDITNTGSRFGKEIAQGYVALKKSQVYRPAKELKIFSKVSLEAKETTTIKWEIPVNNLAIHQKEFKVEAGMYDFYVGSSSRDLRLEGRIKIESSDTVLADTLDTYQNVHTTFLPKDKDFEKLLGHKIPPSPSIKPYHINSPLEDLKKNVVGKVVVRMVRKEFSSLFADKDNPVIAKMMNKMIDQMPLRALVAFSAGKLSYSKTEGLIKMMNGRIVKGMVQFIKG